MFILILAAAVAAVGEAHAQRGVADSLLRTLPSAKNGDVRLELLFELSEALQRVNPDSALLVATQAQKLAESMGTSSGLMRAFRLQGDALSRNTDGTGAVRMYRKALAIKSENPKDVVYRGHVLRQLGLAYYHQAHYDSALAEMFHALEVFSHDSLKRDRAGVLNNIGNVHYFTNRRQAIGYYKQSLAIHEELGNLDGMASQYGNIGLIHVAEGDTAKAIDHSKRSLEIYEQLGHESSIATSQINLAHTYREFGMFAEALPYALQSLELRRKLNENKGMAVSTIVLASIHMDMADYAKAIPLYEEGIDMVHRLGLRSYEWEAMYHLARCHVLSGRPEKAVALYPRVIEIKDSIYKDESTAQIAKMEALYQTQKDGKVKLLEREAEINELQLRKRETYLAAATAITFLLGIMSLMAFFAYRSKARVNSILEKKNHLIEEQKKEITDSIRYAENIQRALLPPADVLRAVFPDSFIFHRPKDIVSGDFYWIHDLPDRVYFAVVDCTGHGVPGAFMSFIGTSALNRAITDLRLVSPSDILSGLSDQVSEMLRSGRGTDVKDGMDLALCCYFKQSGELHYAGAYNPLWVLRNGQMEVIRADKQPVGETFGRRPFTNHIVHVTKGDAVYLFSDGYADQFGGTDDKKIGTAKFRAKVASIGHLPLRDQGEVLSQFFDSWKGAAEQVDDVCVMGIRF